MNPGLPQPLVWDEGMGADPSHSAAIRDLMARAFKVPPPAPPLTLHCACSSRQGPIYKCILPFCLRGLGGGQGPLVPAQQQEVLRALEGDPRAVHQCGLTPRRLPLLVEHNPLIAIEVLACVHSPCMLLAHPTNRPMIVNACAHATAHVPAAISPHVRSFHQVSDIAPCLRCW